MTDEEMQCRLMALAREKWPEWFLKRPDLRIVGKPLPPPPPAETFRDAAASIGDFAQSWRDGTATLSEIEDADTQLLGMRRLLDEKMQALEAQS